MKRKLDFLRKRICVTGLLVASLAGGIAAPAMPGLLSAERVLADPIEVIDVAGLIDINEAFPDKVFGAYVYENFDKNQDGFLNEDEIADVTHLDCSNQQIEDLTGVEIFWDLQELDCFDNNLSSLDVSQNKALRSLRCYNNRLTSLDLSNNTELEYPPVDDDQNKLISVVDGGIPIADIDPSIDTGKIKNLKGARLGKGKLIDINSDKITYDYSTGYNDHVMPVTLTLDNISEKTDIPVNVQWLDENGNVTNKRPDVSYNYQLSLYEEFGDDDEVQIYAAWEHKYNEIGIGFSLNREDGKDVYDVYGNEVDTIYWSLYDQESQSFKNLPLKDSDGNIIKYYVTVSKAHTPGFQEGELRRNDDTDITKGFTYCATEIKGVDIPVWLKWVEADGITQATPPDDFELTLSLRDKNIDSAYNYVYDIYDWYIAGVTVGPEKQSCRFYDACVYDENGKPMDYYIRVGGKVDGFEFESQQVDENDLSRGFYAVLKKKAPDTYPVNISKADNNGIYVEGAVIKVTGEDYEEEWRSTAEPHKLMLKPGDYTLAELVAPEGFKKVTSTIEFTVDDKGNITVITTKVDNGFVAVRPDGTLVILDESEDEIPEIEKYVDKAVHKEVGLDDIFTYDVVAYVTKDADDVVIKDELIADLEFVSNAGAVKVSDLGECNNHKVINNIAAERVHDDATAASDGIPVANAAVTVNNRTLTVVIPDATAVRGHWVKVTFEAKIAAGKTFEDLQHTYTYITENDPVLSSEAHYGVPNKACYKIGVKYIKLNEDGTPVLDENGKPVKEDSTTPRYEDESNTVTVKPTEPSQVVAKNITLDKKQLVLSAGKSGRLVSTIMPENTDDKTVIWSSSNTNIAKVDENGKVTAVKHGTAKITAKTSNGKTATCEVRVNFIDVTKPSWYYNAVYWAADNGITTGTKGLFKPASYCTREQAITFLWRLAGKPTPKSMVSKFSDVNDKKRYSYKAIMWGTEKGIITGSKGKFYPSSICTREQIVTMIWRLAGKPSPKKTSSKFKDVTNPKSYSYKAIIWAEEQGIAKGSDDLFRPATKCKRRDIVTFIYRYNNTVL